MRTFFTAVVALMLTSAADAGQVTGNVVYVVQRASDGLVYASVTGVPTGQPSCAANNYWMIANENAEAGKKQFAMLLLAKASGLRVTLKGTGTCTRWGDGEDINEIMLVD